MTTLSEIAAVYENGVLRPEADLGLPEHTRLVLAIKRISPDPEAQERAKRMLHEIRERGLFRTDGKRLTRDELHERH